VVDLSEVSWSLKAVVEYLNINYLSPNGPKLNAGLLSPSEAQLRQQRVEAERLRLEQLAAPSRVSSVTFAEFESIRARLLKDGCSWPNELTSNVAQALARWT
jgi:hypothetical protein